MISCQSDKLTSDLIFHTQQAYMTGLPSYPHLTFILFIPKKKSNYTWPTSNDPEEQKPS